ncbi:MAG: methyl-accepting chemotaxis protein [Ruminococcus sp.]|jgi:methyl-accepting chemotaxis protein|nr:methyl-accepting chemotaxis protein [Ruminococcus sp.]
MKNLKIGMKLFVTFAIIIVLLIATAGVAIYGLTTEGKSFKNFYEKPYVNSQKVIDAERLIQKTAKDVAYGAVVSKLENINAYADALETDYAEAKQEVKEIEELTSSEDAIAKLKEVDELFASIDDEMAQVASLIRETGKYCPESETANPTKFAELNEEILNMYFGVDRVVTEESSGTIGNFLKANAALEEASEFIAKAGDTEYDNAHEAQTTSQTALIVVAILAVLISVIMAVYITNLIAKPVKEIEEATIKMSNFDLSANITYNSKDELGSLSGAAKNLISTLKDVIKDLSENMEQMSKGNFDVYSNGNFYKGEMAKVHASFTEAIKQLSVTVVQIDQSSDQVANGSDQVSNGAQALSQGATEQASSVEELAATIGNISAAVNKSAENAKVASGVAAQAGATMEVANGKMEEMVVAMQNISDTSNEISKIIKSIEDIAFQTNILALNASVEAARAGAAGKGFAVVANEVGSLASKSAEASKSTAELIESSVRAVEIGTKIVDETAKSLVEVGKSAGEVVAKVNEIAKMSEQQADSLDQVTLGVDQISAVVQTNSATAEESAAASEQLSGQSQMLKKLVAVFNPNKQFTQNIYQTEFSPAPIAPSAPKFTGVNTPPPPRTIDLGNDKY